MSRHAAITAATTSIIATVDGVTHSFDSPSGEAEGRGQEAEGKILN